MPEARKASHLSGISRAMPKAGTTVNLLVLRQLACHARTAVGAVRYAKVRASDMANLQTERG